MGASWMQQHGPSGPHEPGLTMSHPGRQQRLSPSSSPLGPTVPPPPPSVFPPLVAEHSVGQLQDMEAHNRALEAWSSSTTMPAAGSYDQWHLHAGGAVVGGETQTCMKKKRQKTSKAPETASVAEGPDVD